jgi:hypothetical protein
MGPGAISALFVRAALALGAACAATTGADASMRNRVEGIRAFFSWMRSMDWT